MTYETVRSGPRPKSWAPALARLGLIALVFARTGKNRALSRRAGPSGPFAWAEGPEKRDFS